MLAWCKHDASMDMKCKHGYHMQAWSCHASMRKWIWGMLAWGVSIMQAVIICFWFLDLLVGVILGTYRPALSHNSSIDSCVSVQSQACRIFYNSPMQANTMSTWKPRTVLSDSGFRQWCSYASQVVCGEGSGYRLVRLDLSLAMYVRPETEEQLMNGACAACATFDKSSCTCINIRVRMYILYLRMRYWKHEPRTEPRSNWWTGRVLPLTKATAHA